MAYQAKTLVNDESVDAFITSIEDPKRRADCVVLREMMTRISGEPAKMWGPSIVGFGEYHYHYESGHSGTACRLGFSPRKAALSIYILPGYGDFTDILARLGKHSTGKSCLYVKKLGDIDMAVLEELVVAGLKRMDELYPR